MIEALADPPARYIAEDENDGALRRAHIMDNHLAIADRIFNKVRGRYKGLQKLIHFGLLKFYIKKSINLD